ncbi:peptidoglycan-binding domain-containing protein [Streptomyces tendae]|uniref:peptidoglycan-binding domain-containing protein n=1 Tax=Streptomyces tendae TaxID=1932 RepID=UPI00132F57F0|nr:peptidoglycan-binding protein [Streptomyces tendae]
MLKKRWKIGLATLASGMATVLAVSPAHAAYSQNSGAYSTSFVDGAGKLTDDFGDHFDELGNSLCYGCGESSNTDIVVLWQSILVAEELLGFSDIDGQFGPTTRNATIKWQQRYGLGADGMVGDKTWSKADDRLVWLSNIDVSYTGKYNSGAVIFHRGSTSKNKDSGAYKLAKVYQYDGVKSMRGTRAQFRSLTTL